VEDLSEREIAVRRRLKNDFEHYALKCLTIRPKIGKPGPLKLNVAQQYIHSRLEEQRERTGRVRAIILKGRQQGCSTYVEGRFYWRVSHKPGVRAFILTHEQEATNNLFEMAQRYHDNCPALVKPSTGAANAKELSFDRLDSGYKVGTAGTKAVGRSQTIQFFHGSEVAFWPNAETHAGGVLQAIPDAPDTEVILESTANGLGNWFHKQWQMAERGEGEFIAIFVPWFWQPEYRKAFNGEFARTQEEAELAELYGLDDQQLNWRRSKIIELGQSVEMFRQEYPNTSEEAFQTSLEHAVIPIALVKAAVDRDVRQTGRKVIWGLDVARSLTGDRSALAKRWGNHQIEPVKAWRIPDTMQLAGIIYREYLGAEQRPDEINVDSIGFGAGVVDRLRELGLPANGINVAESPSFDPDLYMRRRDELWFRAREWFAGKDVRVPNDPALISELTSVLYKFTSSGKQQVESKDEMKARGMDSPDLADAFNLTFATSDLLASSATYVPPMHYDS
jgi:hypothetical protein